MFSFIYPRLTIRRSFWTLDLCIAILCALFMGRVLVGFFYPESQSRSVESSPRDDVVPVLLPPVTPPELKNLDKVGIFGEDSFTQENVVPEEPPPPEPTNELKESEDKNLMVLGIVYRGLEPAMSQAIIQNRKLRKPGVYRVGDEIVPEVRVVEIWPLRVILDERGERTYLDYNPEEDTSAVQLASAAAARTPPSRAQPAAVPRSIEVSRDEMAERVDELLELRETATVEPYEENGRPVGLQVSNLGDSELAKEIGIQDGDVIETINGVRITDETSALDALSKFTDSSMIRVGMRRGGRRMYMTYRIR